MKLLFDSDSDSDNDSDSDSDSDNDSDSVHGVTLLETCLSRICILMRSLSVI